MNEAPVPQSLHVSLPAMIALGVEHWRLRAWLAPETENPRSAPARHALRKIADLLKSCELEVRDMTGIPFDAGLAIRVVETIEDPKLPPERIVICETLSPMVLWRGQVVRPAEVVTRRGAPR